MVADAIYTYNNRSNPILCTPYHAGLSDEARERAQDDWTSGFIQVMVFHHILYLMMLLCLYFR